MKPSIRIQLAEAAADAWMLDPSFSLAELADATGVTLADVLREFDDRTALLSYYYESRWALYGSLKAQVPDFESYSVEEKLSNLFYSLIDLMSDRKGFVARTAFDHLSASAIPGATLHPFQREFRGEIRSILGSKDASAGAKAQDVSAAGRLAIITPVLDALYASFLGILYFWIHDESKEGERTAALIDKWIALISELFRSSIADKSIDLARFLAKDVRGLLPDSLPFPFNRLSAHLPESWGNLTSLDDLGRRLKQTLSDCSDNRKGAR